MKVNNISSVNNFGKINLCDALYKNLRKSPDIDVLAQRLVRGKNASVIGNDTEGFFMRTANDSQIFLGNNPTVKSILKIIDGLNAAR